MRQRGVAAVELALGMTLFLPLLFILIDYGYFFYVSITAVEAARVGARQVWSQTVTSCSNAANVTAARGIVEASSGKAMTYMNQIGMVSATTVTATCSTALASPARTLGSRLAFQVKVDFLAASAHVRPRDSEIGDARSWAVHRDLVLQGQ